jgi:hypothetical protein
VDGTLLREGTDGINPEIFDVIRKLKEKGIIFAAASGRQYGSLRKLFAPVKNDILFIADNGSNVMCKGMEVRASVIEQTLLEDLIGKIREIDDCYIVISDSKGECYLERENEELDDFLINGYHYDVHHVEDVLKAPISIIKCAIYRKHNIEEIAPYFMERYVKRLNVTISGEIWLDFMNLDSDKGHALRDIQKTMNILPEETMAFGDNMNDMGMLRAAGESYAVANAAEQVKAEAKHVAGSFEEDGVLKVLKGLLETL